MAKKNITAGLVLLLIGLFLLFGISSIGDVQRMDQPSYDGQRDFFKINIVDHADRAEVSDIFWVDLEVTNILEQDGQMFVQCSILDRTVHTWIPQVQSVIYSGVDNCVADEPFTQTALVSLNSLEQEIVKYSFRTPSTVGGDNVIWCEAFEQCWSEDVEPMQSDNAVKPITVLAADENTNNDNLATDGDECEVSDDCSSWFSLSEIQCVNGYCVDEVDSPGFELSSLGDTELKEWAGENKMLLVGLGFLLVLIGAIIVYREPKKPKFGYY